MRKNEFIEEILAVASAFGKAKTIDVKKTTGTYTGVVVEKIGIPSPVVNIDSLYSAYILGDISMEECKSRARKILMNKPDMNFEFNIRDIGMWGIVKNQLYLRLTNNNANSIYRTVEDMFLVPYIRLSADDSAATRVTKELLDLWGVDEDEVFEQAEINQVNIRPVKITDLGTALGLPCPFDVVIITTKNDLCGASAIFYPGIFEELYDRLGEFYLIPSSIHEMLAISKSNAADPEDLRNMVKTINADSVDECDRLTDSIYTFDFKNEKFRKVE